MTRATVAGALLVGLASLAAGGPSGSVAALAGLGLVLACTRLISDASEKTLRHIATWAYFAHALLSVGLHMVLVTTTGEATAFQDDISYHRLATTIAAYWHDAGGPVSTSDLYLVNTYVVAMAFVYYVLGASIVIAVLLNAAFIVVAALFTLVTVRAWADRRASLGAFALVATFPSLAFWSALNLKEALALALMAAAIWAVTRLLRSGSWQWAPISVVLLIALEETRRYPYLVLAVAIPIYVFVARRGAIRPRLAWTVGSITVLALLTGFLDAYGGQPAQPTSLARLPLVRANMAVNARTAFVSPVEQYISVPEGTVVSFASPSPPPFASPSPPPGSPRRPEPCTGRLVVVRPGTRIVVVPAADQLPATAAGEIAVHSCDTVLVSTVPDTTPAPDAPVLALTTDRNVTLLRPGEQQPAEAPDAFVLNLQHIPVGAIYVLGAPFPWQARTASEIAVIPDMLLWYLTAALALVGLVDLARRREADALLVALTVLGLGTVLALIEGNTGTLFRHRAMLIPLACALACERFTWLAGQVGREVSRRTPDARVRA